VSHRPTRRAVLKGAVVLAALPVAGFTGRRRLSPVPKDPFTLGVASGDPAPDGAVIWTRLAPEPLADDGLGGMPARAVDVEWEVATDEAFTRIERRGTTTAVPESAHSVHVDLAGLRPGADYFYRFRSAGYLSPAGRTRTAPGPGSLAPLTMCFASCAHFEQGWFTAYRRLAEEQPDLVVHLGDYQYEYAAGQTTSGRVRDHVGQETVTLANYRQRYAQYKTDPDLQAAHAAAPWLAVFDDHDPAATLTGAQQERWLLDGFAQSGARWDVLGQQVFFSQVELTPGPGRGFNPDAWDGYTANRDRIVAGIVDSPVRNAVVLTGDVHSHWAADVRERPDDPSSRLVATELVTTSISSGGDGSDSRDEIDAVRPENPDIRYFSNRRGYVRTRITPDEVRADFRVLPFVSSPGAPALTGASFVVADRDPTLRPV
jgi:phosphodiesterase/alkaline phosphatase D-like protein